MMLGRWFPLLTCVAVGSAAWGTESPASACAAPEYRQFDFWLGHWEVFTPDGKRAGENRIEKIAGGCALLENWTGASGSSGKSLNIYDAADGKWHQFWVDAAGTRLVLEGSFADGRMVLAGSTPDPKNPGVTIQQRITWAQNDDGSVRQLWERSEDGGKKWTVVFDGNYVRR